VVVAITFPTAGSRTFEACERAFTRLAQKRGLCVSLVGLAALAARAALLPILPIPQPGLQDDFGYLLIADTFAHGRLTNPTHPMWVHFESFQIIWQPTYTAKFYPGQGLIMTAGQIFMGHPYWGVWLSMGLMCAAICWALQGWLPPGWALLGGLLSVIRLGTFNYWANSYWGGAVAATGGALALGALPRIKRSQRARDALLMGLGLALIACSRPYEGLFFGLPVAGALAVWMLGKNRPPLWQAAKRVAAPIFLVLALTAGAMGYYFWRTTGSPFDTPYLVHERTYDPVRDIPWPFSRPPVVYHHPVIEESYRDMLRVHQGLHSTGDTLGRLSAVLVKVCDFFLGPAFTLPLLAALATLPYGFSWRKLSSSTRFLLLVCGVLVAGNMVPYVYVPHYTAPVACAILALVLLAMRRVRTRCGPAGLLLSRAVPVICVLMLLLRAGARPLHLPETPPFLLHGTPIWCALTPQNLARASTLAQLQQLPGRQLAIVRYGPHHDAGLNEWVYNGAEIDAAKVVWARDMGAAKNQELIDYFPDRRVWLVEADDTSPAPLPYNPSPDP